MTTINDTYHGNSGTYKQGQSERILSSEALRRRSPSVDSPSDGLWRQMVAMFVNTRDAIRALLPGPVSSNVQRGKQC